MRVTHLHRRAVAHGSKSHRYSKKPMDHYHFWYHRLSWKCDVQKNCIIPSLEPCYHVTIIWSMIPFLPEDGNHGCNGTWKTTVSFWFSLFCNMSQSWWSGEKMMVTMKIKLMIMENWTWKQTSLITAVIFPLWCVETSAVKKAYCSCFVDHLLWVLHSEWELNGNWVMFELFFVTPVLVVSASQFVRGIVHIFLVGYVILRSV